MITALNDLPHRWQDAIATHETLLRMGFAPRNITARMAGGGGTTLKFGLNVKHGQREYTVTIFKEPRGDAKAAEAEWKRACQLWNRALELDKKWLWVSFRHRQGDRFMADLAEAFVRAGIEPPTLAAMEKQGL